MCVLKFIMIPICCECFVESSSVCVSVSTDIENKQQFKQCFSESGVKLPVGYFLGVSAATGDLSDTHDIISLKMFDLSTPDDVSQTMSA